MIVSIRENENNSQTLAEFKTCIFNHPLRVYYFNGHYDLDEDAYNSYVEKTETFLQMIIYMYSIFICTFGFVGTIKSCLFCCNEYRYETYLANHPRRRGLFFSSRENQVRQGRVFPMQDSLVEELDLSSILLQERVTDDPCVICLEGLEIGQKVIAHDSCKKLFHASCLKGYFLSVTSNQTLNCPLCRNSFNISIV